MSSSEMEMCKSMLGVLFECLEDVSHEMERGPHEECGHQTMLSADIVCVLREDHAEADKKFFN